MNIVAKTCKRLLFQLTSPIASMLGPSPGNCKELPTRGDFLLYLIDEDYPKRTQSYSLVALLTSSATILIHTADTIGFVINDPSEAVKLKMAASQ